MVSSRKEVSFVSNLLQRLTEDYLPDNCSSETLPGPEQRSVENRPLHRIRDVPS